MVRSDAWVFIGDRSLSPGGWRVGWIPALGRCATLWCAYDTEAYLNVQMDTSTFRCFTTELGQYVLFFHLKHSGGGYIEQSEMEVMAERAFTRRLATACEARDVKLIQEILRSHIYLVPFDLTTADALPDDGKGHTSLDDYGDYPTCNDTPVTLIPERLSDLAGFKNLAERCKVWTCEVSAAGRLLGLRKEKGE